MLILILNVMTIGIMSQNFVYGPTGEKKHFLREETEITFESPSVKVEIPHKKGMELGAGLISSLPTLVNMGFQLTTGILEKRVKQYSCEFLKTQSYLNAGSQEIPKVIFVRKLFFVEGKSEEALKIVLTPYKIDKIQGFIYFVESIDVHYSAARFRRKDSCLDYSIEIKPAFFVNEEKKSVALSPITITSVRPGRNDIVLTGMEKRTDIIIMPNGAFLTEVSLKIVESNPEKIRAEKILSAWSSYRDSTATIINNFLPKEKPSQSGGGGNVPAQNTP